MLLYLSLLSVILGIGLGCLMFLLSFLDETWLGRIAFFVIGFVIYLSLYIPIDYLLSLISS